jgi:hypothetical protein
MRSPEHKQVAFIRGRVLYQCTVKGLQLAKDKAKRLLEKYRIQYPGKVKMLRMIPRNQPKQIQPRRMPEYEYDLSIIKQLPAIACTVVYMSPSHLDGESS